MLHGCGVPVFFCVGLHRGCGGISGEIDDCRAAACDHNSGHSWSELLDGFQDLSSAFDSRVKELAVVLDDAVQKWGGGVDDGVEGGRGLYYVVESAGGGNVGDDAEVQLGRGRVGEVGGYLIGFGLRTDDATD